MDLSEIRKEMKRYGLLRLSQDTGMARSYLYKVSEGESTPTIDSFRKILKVIGYDLQIVKRGIENSIEDVTSRVVEDGNWKVHYFNFVDAFRKSKNSDLILNPPSYLLSDRELALIKSIVVQLCVEADVKIPKWAIEQHFLSEPWFVSGVENLKPMAIVESPVSFKRNNIFVLDNFLSRA